MLLIQLTDISREYDVGAELVRALDGICLSISQGEWLAIVGESGSGKSTLMNVIGCLDTPTRGTYWLNGKEVSQMDDDELAGIRNKEIGFIFQNFQLLPRESALANVELPLVYRNLPGRARRHMALEALRKVKLSDRITHKPTELSGGQRQRVAIARALVTQPSLLLADEPTGNLDSTTGEEIIGLFEDLNASGHTIVLVTHEPRLAARCSRVVRLRDGKIIDEGQESGGARL